MKMEIAERIRMARLAKGLSQQNVALELDLTTAAYSNIERGITDITVSRLVEISRILDKNISELLGLESNANTEDAAALTYRNTIGQQIVTLSQQIGALQLQLDKLENDFRATQG
jgi:XRE family transcriptional regulator, regulator of sulfur utilization